MNFSLEVFHLMDLSFELSDSYAYVLTIYSLVESWVRKGLFIG